MFVLFSSKVMLCFFFFLSPKEHAFNLKTSDFIFLTETPGAKKNPTNQTNTVDTFSFCFSNSVPNLPLFPALLHSFSPCWLI